MTDEKSVEYLQNVLNVWGEFCKSHKPFKRAIQNVLIENSVLKQENEKLKSQIEKLNGN